MVYASHLIFKRRQWQPPVVPRIEGGLLYERLLISLPLLGFQGRLCFVDGQRALVLGIVD